MKSPRDVIIRPVVSEKSYAGLELNTYTFLVDPRSNKTEIKEAVQAIWNVRVTSVNTLRRQGKVKRRGYTVGKRSDQKRAIVTLAQGDSIEIFEAGKYPWPCANTNRPPRGAAARACRTSTSSRAPSPRRRSSPRGATRPGATSTAGSPRATRAAATSAATA